MTQAELAEFLKDAFDGVTWRDRSIEPHGHTTVEKFARAMVKHDLGKLPVRPPEDIGGRSISQQRLITKQPFETRGLEEEAAERTLKEPF